MGRILAILVGIPIGTVPLARTEVCGKKNTLWSRRAAILEVPEESRHFDPRSDGQKRGSGPREFPMHARGPPATFRPTFRLALRRAERKANKNKVAEQRNFLCGAAY